ncbi:hypothetical protein, partial [Ferrovibrio sp.]|uniref:hypothetical protein n=1 Tax=Ferrovibrio sp. TaxID=1917215 RepID=UPI0035AE1822
MMNTPIGIGLYILIGAGLDSMERLSGSYGYEAAPKPAFGKYSSGPDQAIRRWGNSTVGGR